MSTVNGAKLNSSLKVGEVGAYHPRSNAGKEALHSDSKADSDHRAVLPRYLHQHKDRSDNGSKC